MHDSCAPVNMLRRVAVRVHFIVWRRSPILKGALCIHSGVLDGAKNLSLRAGTNSQCIVGARRILQELGMNTFLRIVSRVSACCSFKPVDLSGGLFFGFFSPAVFLRKWSFPVGLIHVQKKKKKEMDLHNISTGRRGVATSKSPQRPSNNHNARIATFITCLYCTIDVLNLLFLYQYVGKHLVWSIYCIMCNSK